MHFFKFFKDVKVSIENKGEELLISAKGTKEDVAHLEKKLGAIKELCGEEECCGRKDGGCC